MEKPVITTLLTIAIIVISYVLMFYFISFSGCQKNIRQFQDKITFYEMQYSAVITNWCIEECDDTRGYENYACIANCKLGKVKESLPK